jgi:hypothetical protein
MGVCPAFPKDRIEGVKANCQFALPSSRDFHSFKASQRHMKALAENNKERSHRRETASYEEQS